MEVRELALVLVEKDLLGKDLLGRREHLTALNLVTGRDVVVEDVGRREGVVAREEWDGSSGERRGSSSSSASEGGHALGWSDDTLAAWRRADRNWQVNETGTSNGSSQRESLDARLRACCWRLSVVRGRRTERWPACVWGGRRKGEGHRARRSERMRECEVKGAWGPPSAGRAGRRGKAARVNESTRGGEGRRETKRDGERRRDNKTRRWGGV